MSYLVNREVIDTKRVSIKEYKIFTKYLNVWNDGIINRRQIVLHMRSAQITILTCHKTIPRITNNDKL